MSHGLLARPRPSSPAAVVLAGGALVAATAIAFTGSVLLMGAAVALLVAVPVALSPTIPWRVLVSVLVCVIVFIPIRRYTFGTGLPIQLEPYRLVAALIIGGWAASLLVDQQTRLRRTGLEGPMLLIGVVALASILSNLGRVAAVEAEVIKSFSFLLSFLLLFFLIATVTRSAHDRDAVLKTLVVGMATVGVLAVFERRTGTSPFTELDRVFPLLHATADDQLVRGSGVRARGPAEHPIALGAALVLVFPISIYLANAARTRKVWWWAASAALAIGALSTLSRTGVLMFLAVGAVYLWLRTRDTVRLWPLLLPFLAVVHFALPGTLGSLRASFFPEEGLVASQDVGTGAYDCSSSGRIADLGPAFRDIAQSPLVGIGFGTRIVAGDESSDPPRNACILDNQWLGTLLEAGVAGVIAWLWLFVRAVKRLGLRARVRGPDGDVCVALAASIAAYAAGMFTFDALGFVQVTFLLFLIIGLAAATLMRGEAQDERAPERLPTPRHAPVL